MRKHDISVVIWKGECHGSSCRSETLPDPAVRQALGQGQYHKPRSGMSSRGSVGLLLSFEPRLLSAQTGCSPLSAQASRLRVQASSWFKRDAVPSP